ncbi:hypothetical protein P8H27_01030 [Pseudomonas sp. sp1636]|uniref:hypothetical protein n=1 Tax=Pseudomonas sp. sp1636 TaxID=3036707 RepID=UPI0025A61D13|nr:hypothetical protein [Pseudomonas sp. sp1636]MDM8347488.1 hypothetical protein [Pseudomonas sp. sp1636]
MHASIGFEVVGFAVIEGDGLGQAAEFRHIGFAQAELPVRNPVLVSERIAQRQELGTGGR